MDKNKQIEEMARTMCFQRESCTVKSCLEVNCEKTWLAEALYDKGYRKATDVAEEIFAEIEGIMAYFPIYGRTNTLIVNENDFAELRKKYTEVL